MTHAQPQPSLIAGLSSEEYDPSRRTGPSSWPERRYRPVWLRLGARAALPFETCSTVEPRRRPSSGPSTPRRAAGSLPCRSRQSTARRRRRPPLPRGDGSYVIDVQTHLVSPTRWRAGKAEALAGFLRMVDPDRWGGGIDPELLSGASWAQKLFGESETNIALLTSLPGRAHENVLTNQEIAACRDLVDRYAGTNRVLTHTIVHPNLGAQEMERLPEWAESLRPAGWKVYTLWDPPELITPGGLGQGWFLDDERIGIPFLEAVRRTTTTIVCAHKGIGATDTGRVSRWVLATRHRAGRRALSRPGVRCVPLGLRARPRRA